MRPRRQLTVTHRAAMRLALLAIIVAAACRGTPKPPAPKPVAKQPAGASDSAAKPLPPKDSVARPAGVTPPALPQTAPPTKADSTKADSVKAAAVADSAMKAAAKTPPKKKPAPTSRNCLLDMTESPPENRMQYQRISDGVSNMFIGGGFVGRCQGENNRLMADSAEHFEGPGIINLFGNVVYEEPRKMQVRATHAIYFTREGRLFADGGVIATALESGSTFSGSSMEYYRATTERPVAKLVAPNRSTVTLIEKDSATGKPGPPTTVMANRFEDAGDSLLYAWGDVVITREKLTGRSDSASFDKLSEMSRLMRAARIINADTARRFTLNGDTIDLYSTNRQLDRVVALHKSHATTSDMQLDAERIDLRLKAQQLTDAYAFGPGRARATTPQQDVEADSLRIRMVDKLAREVRAVGGARAVGAVDSTKIRTPEKDVLRGDSIFAFFDSSAAAMKDTVKGPPIKEIRALSNASSLFHMPSSKGRDGKPSINYVRGARIFVSFDTGAVRTVRVDEQASGLYLEPEDSIIVDTLAAKDSAGKGGKKSAKPATPPKGKTTAPAKPPTPIKPPAGPVDAMVPPLTLFAFRSRRS